MPTDFISAFLDQIVAFIAANPAFAGFICFFVAMGEALFLVGLFFPSTVVLVGAGTLIGLGELSFWPLFVWTTAGAVTGDAISYWVGYTFKDRLRNLWPLNKYPEWLKRGEDYFAEHGGKSIFIGRFVPGVKSVVPGIAGMADMNFVRFSVFNVTSAFAWSALHLVPGVLAGSALFAIGEIDTRLAIVLGALCLALFVALVLVRWLILFLLPILAGSHQAFVNWLAGRPDRLSQWMAKTYDPENPRSVGMLVSAAVLLLCLPLSFWIIGAIATGSTMVRADLAIYNFFEVARTPWLDEVMIALSMLASGVVSACVAASAAIYLTGRKAWRRAIGLAISIASSLGFVVLMRGLFSRGHALSAGISPDVLSPFAGHTTVTTVLMGTLAVLVAHERSRRSKALIYSAVAIYTILIGFSRIYLGEHWLSDVLAGGLFATAIVGAFAFVFGHIHNEKVARTSLGLLVGLVLALVGGLHIYTNFSSAQKRYAPRVELRYMTEADWIDGGWSEVAPRRISLSGELKEPLVLQWLGTPEELQENLSAQGWEPAERWSLPSVTGFVQGSTPAAKLPPLLLTNLGNLPALILVRETDADHRDVLWLWATNFKIFKKQDAAASVLFVGAVQGEEAIRLLGEFSGVKQEKQPAKLEGMFHGLPVVGLKWREDGTKIILASPQQEAK
ncbi:bifunctional DedA family/phosphatase PAP2 family protein [Polycladidibacter hongkongensis]|uniref:bifunctional DedA family/phosphatase PAP2 family protein n=1 Tax=Polycladidibacter hongkongensis TaxID=1647556 RepID=UPI0008325A59|nr:bifunctional DedA family/phosphatase PAP2 family protein [Pseudovibrio hongkongensis]